MAGEPQLTQTNPQAYYMWLVRSQRMPPQQAYELVQQRFGAAKTPEQQQKEAADAQQNNSLAQIGGMVGGSVAASQIPALASQVGSLFGGGAAATGSGAVATPATLGGYTSLSGAGAAGSGAAGTAGASTLGSIGSVALPVAVAAAVLNNAWETGGQDILRGRGDKADWANQGVNMLGPGTNIALRLLGKRSVGAMMKSGKSDDQMLRDDFRGLLKEQGIADDKYNVKLADGSTFNIGLDGKTKYKNVGKNVDGKEERNAWDIDYSNNLSNFAVGKLDPLVRGAYGDNKAVKAEQFTGMLVNAALSNAKSEDDVMANIKSILGGSEFGKQFGAAAPAPVQRPGKGQVARVSPGMYMDDQGRVSRAKTVRQALEQNYGKSSNKGKSK